MRMIGSIWVKGESTYRVICLANYSKGLSKNHTYRMRGIYWWKWSAMAKRLKRKSNSYLINVLWVGVLYMLLQQEFGATVPTKIGFWLEWPRYWRERPTIWQHFLIWEKSQRPITLLGMIQLKGYCIILIGVCCVPLRLQMAKKLVSLNIWLWWYRLQTNLLRSKMMKSQELCCVQNGCKNHRKQRRSRSWEKQRYLWMATGWPTRVSPSNSCKNSGSCVDQEP